MTATSNDAWGPSGTDMAEIAKITYNRFVYHTYYAGRVRYHKHGLQD